MSQTEVDVLVVGAGFSGMYLLHRLRTAGFSARVVESADDVGGTWYWNRYPGARCDIPTTDYTYGWDPELEEQWTWSEKYATQPEILRYAQFVADKHDLRQDISFNTKIEKAVWHEESKRWHLSTPTGDSFVAKFYVMATGCLSVPKELDITGAAKFTGPSYFTSRWPHEGVDFTGMRVGVVGTGSSGIQSIPIIAQQAASLTVFQRTPNFSVPARNGAAPAERLAAIADDRAGYRHAAKYSPGGAPGERTELSALTTPEDVRRERFETAYAKGELFEILGVFADQIVNPKANEIVAEMIREKIRAKVNDPVTAELLCPKDHPFGTKRPCLDTNYYETYNLPHVKLVDIRTNPIETVTETGIKTTAESYEFDAIVYATGFDAMTGALVAVDVTGRNGVVLKDKWADGPQTYLGLTTVGFPNFFALTGPGSPSVLSNMAVSIEQHVDWVADCLEYLRAHSFDTIEPTPTAEHGWVRHVNDGADITLMPIANSWYMGANVPGKPRVFLPYVAGVETYRKTCEEVVARDYLGFTLVGPGKEQTNDGLIRELQVDVHGMLDLMATMEIPPLETLPVDMGRMMMEAGTAARPSGPDVGEIVDGVMPAADGSDMKYRLYRPASPGPHPIVVYYHGGGWVLGSETSDDPLCRDLCHRSDMIVVSVNYRHAPEARFPAAADDGLAALQWIAKHADQLGGDGQLVVAGWSAGGNVAAVTAQLAKQAGGPALGGQLLLTPVTDGVNRRPSYDQNGLGYVLTSSLMDWFWDHYVDGADRANPKASPLLAADLSGLPPAVIVTAQFDPLRDQGDAYAEALRAAGVSVTHVQARGHIHTSIAMVDVIISGAPIRAQMAEGLRSFIKAPATV